MKPEALAELCVSASDTIQVAAERLNRNLRGIVLVIDEVGCLLDTITDGDIRRGMLAGLGLDSRIEVLRERKGRLAGVALLAAPPDADATALVQLMRERSVRQVPIVHHDGRVAGLVTLEELLPTAGALPVRAVIMAGGLGTRLRPLTEHVPKPLLPLGDRSVVERLITQLHDAGVRHVAVVTHYRGDQIRERLGDGQALGVTVTYVDEDRPLGTAGALALMELPGVPILVVNGDILTNVDLRAMLEYHRENAADVTIGVRRYELNVPFGVVDIEGPNVRGVREKPAMHVFVNVGMYLMKPTMHSYLQAGAACDMPELVNRLIRAGRSVVSFPVVGYWLDIGRMTDYEQAQADLREGRAL